jgi:hypothetical protein
MRTLSPQEVQSVSGGALPSFFTDPSVPFSEKLFAIFFPKTYVSILTFAFSFLGG